MQYYGPWGSVAVGDLGDWPRCRSSLIITLKECFIVRNQTQLPNNLPVFMPLASQQCLPQVRFSSWPRQVRSKRFDESLPPISRLMRRHQHDNSF